MTVLKVRECKSLSPGWKPCIRHTQPQLRAGLLGFVTLSDRGGRKISRITKLPVRLVAKLLALLASRRCCLAVVFSWINYLNTKHFMTFHVVTTSSWVSLKLALWLHYIPKYSPISLMMFWDFWANNGLVAQQRFYHSRKLTGVLMIVHCFCPGES